MVARGASLFVAGENGVIHEWAGSQAPPRNVADCGGRVRCLARLGGNTGPIIAGTWHGKVVVVRADGDPVTFDAPA
jgi:hypothetical protein